MPNPPPYLWRLCDGDYGVSPREAAAQLGLTISQLLPLVDCRLVPHARTFGGHRRFGEADIAHIRAALASGQVTVGARKPKKGSLARARAQEARERFLRRSDPDRGANLITLSLDKDCALALDALQAAYGGTAHDILYKLIYIAAAPLKNNLTTQNK